MKNSNQKFFFKIIKKLNNTIIIFKLKLKRIFKKKNFFIEKKIIFQIYMLFVIF